MRRKVKSTSDRYGEVGASADWKAVLEHYYWDRVDRAYELALTLGASYGASVLGLYRMIEGEALTRKVSEIRTVREWMQLETVDSELVGIEGLEDRVAKACETVGEMLGWDHSEAAMVSVLLAEADAPWHGARFGYFTDKYPYDKICIPNSACRNDDRLREVVLHEYTHLVVLNKTQGEAPDWLQEGLAMLIEGESLESCAHPFRIGHAKWLKPEELERAFHAERRDASTYGRVWHAYQQAGVLGHYLLTRQGYDGIRQMLDAFTHNSFWKEVKMSVTGEPSAEEALRDVFAFGVTELFDTAHRWIGAM